MNEQILPPKPIKPIPLLLLGLGLILIAASVFLFKRDAGAQTIPSDLSAVPAKANFPAPEVTLTDTRGESHSLRDYRGQVVLVNLWATWCPPCKAEMPTLVAYHNEHTADGFTVIAVEAGDPADTVSPFVESFKMTFPVWLDPDGESLKGFGNGSLPNSYVIDRTGTVRYAWTGEISKAMLEKYVTPLIAESN